MTILIASDPAFQFIYRANIDALRQVGSVSFFSPLADSSLPPCDLLYLPGGYPELFAEGLAANLSMRQHIRDYAMGGGRIFAECGGFMYLCSDMDGQPMCGVLPLSVTMRDSRLRLGYRQMEWGGLHLKGHEFHYSSIVDDSKLPSAISVLRLQSSALGMPVDTPIYQCSRVTAGYTHWYWADKSPSEILTFMSGNLS